MAPTVERVAPPVILGEGPLWDETNQKLYFVDIIGQSICRLDPATGKVTSAHLSKGMVGVVVQVEGSSDKLVVGCNREVLLVTWNGESDAKDPPVKTLATIEVDRNDTRINDGKCDPAGRFWFGTMAIEVDGVIRPNLGSFYKCGEGLDVKKILTPVSISNGLTWNKNKDTMYYIDSPTRQVLGFDYDNNTGEIKNSRMVFDLEKNNVVGLPDGMTSDSEDNLWIALFNGGAVIQVNPRNGTLLQTVKLPADKITSVAFGGPNYDILYVTSAAYGMTDDQVKEKPDSGSTFAIKNLNVRGFPPTKFRMDLFH